MRQFWDLIEETLGPDFFKDQELHRDVLELSDALTTGREDLPADYINSAEMQRAYLAYFVPLNFEKARMILSSHSGVWAPKVSTEPQTWIDLGCGPGTAALAALASFKNRYKKEEKLPAIHIDLVDAQAHALQTAGSLVEGFAKKLGLTVTVGLHPSLASALKQGKRAYDLSLAANVLNELPAEGEHGVREAMMQLWDATIGVMLVLEPSHRVSSQRLIRFRERLLKDAASTPEKNNARVLGPCQHSERCPIYRTQHWCHFSEPVSDGRLTDLSLRIFKNARGWLKFSYFLVRRGEPLTPFATRQDKAYRAIGDLHMAGAKHISIDLCQPIEKYPLRVPRNIPPELRETLVRGAVVREKDHHIEAKPMSKRELNIKPLSDEKRESKRIAKNKK